VQQEGSWFTTPFCFYEALGVLKVKYLYRKEITEDVFRKASFDLMADYRGTPKTHDLDLMDPYCFSFIQNLAKKYNLDISDAFQIGSILKGCPFVNDSQTILVTNDNDLAKAARGENCKVWYLADDPPVR
jgi:hypothetical protein